MESGWHLGSVAELAVQLELLAVGALDDGALALIQRLERAVAALVARGYVARGYLGASLHPLAGQGSGGGVIVVGLESEGPAARAGLVVGDIITTWNGEAVATVGAISGRLGTKKKKQEGKDWQERVEGKQGRQVEKEDARGGQRKKKKGRTTQRRGVKREKEE